MKLSLNNAKIENVSLGYGDVLITSSGRTVMLIKVGGMFPCGLLDLGTMEIVNSYASTEVLEKTINDGDGICITNNVYESLREVIEKDSLELKKID